MRVPRLVLSCDGLIIEGLNFRGCKPDRNFGAFFSKGSHGIEMKVITDDDGLTLINGRGQVTCSGQFQVWRGADA